MDFITPSTTNPLVPTTTPVFGDNVQDLLNAGLVNAKPTGIIVVNSIDDVLGRPGVTTLRDAINKANADSGEDLIVFERSLFSKAQTITLNLGELDITHNLDIIAPRDSLTGGDLVTVSGNKASRVFEIETGATVNLNGLIVADGQVIDDIGGGGIKNSGTLALENSIIRNNSALTKTRFSGGIFGGGILNSGTLTLESSTVSDNSLSAISFRNNRYGCGISSQGSLTVSNSTISGNFGDNTSGGNINGGGIYSTDNLKVSNSTISGNNSGNLGSGSGIYTSFGSAVISNSTISNNSGSLSGGGIFSSRGMLTLTNSTVGSNISKGSGGGIYSSSTTVVTNSTISGNLADGGGGISIINDQNTTLTVTNSTIKNNTVTGIGGGGGIYNGFSTIKVSNSTISGNSAGREGGGIYNNGTAVVSNSTISSNSGGTNGGGIFNERSAILTLLFNTLTLNQAANGGGVYNSPGLIDGTFTAPSGSTSARNTIIAANLNSKGGINPDVSGTFTSSGYNLIGNSTGSTGFGVTGDIVGTSALPINPRLDSLKSNGGPTQTIALLKNSPAINTGDPTVLPTDPKTDQRGKTRVQRGRSDIGAFESSFV